MGRILVLGGTEFLGIHLTECLIEAGHDVTLLNRGRTNAHLFPNQRRLIGDRDGDMSSLTQRDWDTIYDLSGYEPSHVEDLSRLVNADVQYVFISSISVYSDMSVGPIVEDSPVTQVALRDVDRESPESYGELKALAERAVRDSFASHVIVRPGVICGAQDPSDRVTYWVTRLASPGPHLVPERRDVPVQFVDAHDLARWLVLLQGGSVRGTFNAVAPPQALDSFLRQISALAGVQVSMVGVSEGQMRDLDILPWKDMPMWLPPSDDSKKAFFDVDASQAASAGFETRPLSETIDAIQAWADSSRLAESPRYGLSVAREGDLLNALAR